MPSPRPKPTPGDPARTTDLLQCARLAVQLLRDPRVPALVKLIPLLAVVYVLSPIDLLPDTIPVLTQLDDVAVLLLALRMFLDLAPAEVRSEIAGAAGAPPAEPITTTYRVKDEDVPPPSG